MPPVRTSFLKLSRPSAAPIPKFGMLVRHLHALGNTGR